MSALLSGFRVPAADHVPAAPRQTAPLDILLILALDKGLLPGGAHEFCQKASAQ